MKDAREAEMPRWQHQPLPSIVQTDKLCFGMGSIWFSECVPQVFQRGRSCAALFWVIIGAFLQCKKFICRWQGWQMPGGILSPSNWKPCTWMSVICSDVNPQAVSKKEAEKRQSCWRMYRSPFKPTTSQDKWKELGLVNDPFSTWVVKLGEHVMTN